MEVDEDLKEFLIESSENLTQLDRELIQLEQFPSDIKLISSVFRSIHTIKGTCGFFGFDVLGSVAHITENILSQVRERKRDLTPTLISLILESVDVIKGLLDSVERTGAEGDSQAATLLLVRLEHAHDQKDEPAAPAEEKSKEAPKAAIEAPVAAAAVVAAPVVVAPVEEVVAESEPVAVPKPAAVPALTVPAAPEPALAKAIETVPEALAVVSAPAAISAPAPAAVPAAAPAAAKDHPAESGKDGALVDSTIRVDVKLLNKLMNLVGELVLARNQLLQDTSAQNSSLQQTSQRLNLITSELQEGVMKTRMQPIGVLWNKLPRVVRDLASKCGKEVKVEMDGAGTELDKTILEAIKDPLTHIVRNSCDHGIETPDVRAAKGKSPEGLLTLRAYHEGGVVNIEISDDGAGIDPEKVKAKAIEKQLIRPEQAAQMSVRDAIHLIFAPGFSTAAQVTSISGRGVGMDVVKTNIEKIGGSVEVFNRPEAGTTIRIKIPLTLAIIPGLVVTLDAVAGSGDRRCGKEERFVIPQANLLELVRLESAKDLERIESVHGTPIFHHRGKLLPLAYLSNVLGRTNETAARQVINIIVLQAENRQMGLVVDQICDTQEIVVKPLGRQLKGLSCYVGATIMGDGRPALILDVVGLARLAGLTSQQRQNTPVTAATTTDSSQPHMLLLFKAGRFERLAVPLSMVTRLEEIPRDKIERAAGKLVLYYRGDILPIVCLTHALDPSAPELAMLGETVQFIVFTDGVRRIGVVVDQIVDIVKEAITVKRSSPVAGLLGSAVIGGKITDMIDLHTLVAATGENWLDLSPRTMEERRKVLLVDPAVTPREILHEFLNISGYEVTQANTVEEALPLARRISFDVVVTAVEMPVENGYSLVNSMRQEKMLQNIPVLGLFDSEGHMDAENSRAIFDGRLVRTEREHLLGTISALIRNANAMQQEVL